jgi:hypothetical protein
LLKKNESRHKEPKYPRDYYKKEEEKPKKKKAER